MELLFLSQQKIFALTHRWVYTLMVDLFQILNQFVLLFRKNVIEKSSMIWRVFPLLKINTRISETPCMYRKKMGQICQSYDVINIFSKWKATIPIILFDKAYFSGL
jgi:hypothetical protein